MAGPLASMFAQLLQREGDQRQPMERANPYMNPYLDESPPLRDRTTFERAPSFRDPQQGGPEPPVDPRVLARLFGDK